MLSPSCSGASTNTNGSNGLTSSSSPGAPNDAPEVKVVEPYRVLHEGKPYVGGDVLDVPDDAEHKIWLQSGWVTKEK